MSQQTKTTTGDNLKEVERELIDFCHVLLHWVNPETMPNEPEWYSEFVYLMTRVPNLSNGQFAEIAKRFNVEWMPADDDPNLDEVPF